MNVETGTDGLIFKYDYTVLPEQFRTNGILGNPAELLRTRETDEILRLCDVEEKEIGNSASDYEYFRALCRSVPLLTGHPLVPYWEMTLSAVLHGTVALSPATCDAVWRRMVTVTEEHPLFVWETLRRLSGTETPSLLSCTAEVPAGAVPVFDADTLNRINETDWEAWKSSADCLLDSFAEKGCRTVRFRSVSMVGRLPSRYDAEQYLKRREGTPENERMWAAQTLRYLAVASRRLGFCLLIEPETVDAAFCGIIRETGRAVGLPETVCSVTDTAGMEHLRHLPEVACAIRVGAFPSDGELKAALGAYAARFPIGKLRAVTGCDMRNVVGERQRLTDALCAIKQ